MKSSIIIFFFLLFNCLFTHGQTWSEWFKQKKTQKKYLLEQIAAYQVYLGYAKKSYDLAKDGTKLIGDIKNGDFGLHNEYFNSLKIVNPKIKDASQTRDLLAMYLAMEKSRSAVLKLTESSKVFSTEEKIAIFDFHTNLKKEVEKNMGEMKLLTENGRLELTDDERILRIGDLYREMQLKYGLQLQTAAKIKAVAVSRISDNNSLESLKKLYGY